MRQKTRGDLSRTSRNKPPAGMAAEAAYNAPTRVLRRLTPPNRSRRNGLTARPQARSSDAVMEGCCHFFANIIPYSAHNVYGNANWRFPNFRRYCRPFPTPRAEFQKLRWLGFPLTLHCSALFNHGQVSLFCSVQSGLRPIYATQSHPKTLLPAHIQSL